ncbi:MAG: tripartite tricarboxylate transporter substrate binding protein [Pseudomonadota bacterium]|nr:tripartite tricarboxylate transporter substrate binding protein [Pseudomonadota bacterium]
MTEVRSSCRALLSGVVCALAVLAPAANAQTAAYPAKPITLVVPFSPGGFTDVVARVIADGLAKSLGQAVLIDNRPGAGSTLGADFVAKAAPDGYTLLMISTTHVISPAMYAKLPYDATKSFTPVGKLVEGPYVMVVNGKLPAKTVKEFIALAKAKPGTLDYSSSGNGSSQHLMAAMFGSMAGIKINHIPYRGSGQSVTDLAGGVVQMSFVGAPIAVQHAGGGRIRPMAVTTLKRSAQLPDVPTLDEAGVPGYDATIWLGLVAPAGTPPAIVNRLNAELGKVLNTPDTKAAIVATGVEVSLSTPAEFGKLMEAEGRKWGKVVHDVGAKVE